ncbi:MAG: 30S ribosomal protein S6, partial [Chloroflexi bacterium]
MTILHPRLTADETTAAIASVEAQITVQSGEMLSTDVWGRRRLAYPIDGSMDGTYVLMTFKMPPAGASPLEAWLIITDPVIR